MFSPLYKIYFLLCRPPAEPEPWVTSQSPACGRRVRFGCRHPHPWHGWREGLPCPSRPYKRAHRRSLPCRGRHAYCRCTAYQWERRPRPVYGHSAGCARPGSGTDGAMLTARGLICPNLGTGSFNHHGRFEFASIQKMEKMVEIVLKIVE